MDRRLLIGSGVGFLSSAPVHAMAQESDLGVRVDMLEAKLADIDSRLAAVESKLGGSTGTSMAPPLASGQTITLKGEDVQLTEAFSLNTGIHPVDAEVTVSGQCDGIGATAYGTDVDAGRWHGMCAVRSQRRQSCHTSASPACRIP